MGVPKLIPVAAQVPEAVVSGDFDALVVVTSNVESLSSLPFSETLLRAIKVDAALTQSAQLLVVKENEACGGRLVVSPTGPLLRDQDDVRRVGDAARAGVLRAKSAGSIRPLLFVNGIPTNEEYSKSLEVALLTSLAGLYEPLQGREAKGESELETVTTLGFIVNDTESGARIAHIVNAMEQGRRVARDIGSGDPERISPLRAAEYCTKAFADTCIKVEVEDNREVLEKEYPCLAAVGRCSYQVERHRPCVVRLTYIPSEGADADDVEALFFAGKGIVYDTGGADIKAGGHMSGMHMDKGGAAGIAGFFKTLSILQPNRLKAIAELGFVRNSSGADNYVADEIIRSHAGVRVMVGNTDAEGRMVLLECVSHLREKALLEKNAKIMTCATLTGHAFRAVGTYAIALDNGPAREQQNAQRIQAAGHNWGDPFEISTLRREDFNIIRSQNTAFDVLQCNNLPSSGTARGHQFPAAFIITASGLSQHGRDSAHPLCFTHLDIAGAASEDGDFQFGKPTGTPVVALTARYVLDKLVV